MSIETLEPGVRRLLAPNPSPWTLEGTNTYLLGEPGGAITVLDPGPQIDAHLDAILAAAPTIERVLITHRHSDHAASAEAFAVRVRAPLEEPDDETTFEVGWRRLETVATPGHSSDHRCFWFADTETLFSGDHVLGRGTTVVAYPDGNMSAYLGSLAVVTALAPRIIYPGHGPTIADPTEVLTFYRAHRFEREGNVAAALTTEARSLEEILGISYADVVDAVLPAARLSLQAHLAKLVDDGVAAAGPDGWTLA